MASQGGPPSRRTLLAGAGAGCAALLAGCTAHDASNGGVTGPPSATSGAPASGEAAVSSATPASGVPAGALAATSQVPVGGGKIIGNGLNIVITQPRAGSFKAFTAVCTHQGCIVSSVSGGTINCPCHGSKYSIENGSVVHGPAPSPLAPVAIKVEGTAIVKA